jgi:hypothetical protein
MNNIYQQKFLEFHREHKNDLLSKEEIISISNSLYSLYPYGTYNKSRVKEISENQNILFGLKSGLLFTDQKCYYFFIHGNSHSVNELAYSELLSIRFEKKLFGEKLVFKNFQEGFKKFEIELFKKLKNIAEECEGIIKQERQKEIAIANALALKNEEIRIEKLSQNQLVILTQLDTNNDGEVDLIENDFNKLFSKNQKRVMDMDKNYIHQFVKVSNFIKTKKQNTQKIFESIRDTSSQEELEERVALLKNQIHSYELLVFHSINMIGALVSADLITFYEIYESFDKLAMFNSNWENEVSEKLTNIGDKLDDLMYSIYNMEQNIVSELSHLSYVTQESFEDLNRSVTSQLKEVESSINTNNLLTGIQAYQLYKINKNTKGIRD